MIDWIRVGDAYPTEGDNVLMYFMQTDGFEEVHAIKVSKYVLSVMYGEQMDEHFMSVTHWAYFNSPNRWEI